MLTVRRRLEDSKTMMYQPRWLKCDRGRVMGTDCGLCVVPEMCESSSTKQFSVQKADVQLQSRIYTIQRVHIPHAWKSPWIQTGTASVAKDNTNCNPQCWSKWTRDYTETTRTAESALVWYYCNRYNILSQQNDVSCKIGLRETAGGFWYSPSWCLLRCYKPVYPMNGVSNCWEDYGFSFSSKLIVKSFACPTSECTQYCPYTLNFLPTWHYV
jgi:hypothetical protein